jgi:hypothetical protein
MSLGIWSIEASVGADLVQAVPGRFELEGGVLDIEVADQQD